MYLSAFISSLYPSLYECMFQKQVMDDRIESVVFRVEEFKSQLEHVQHNMICNAEKIDDLHSYVQQLKELYARVDQVQVNREHSLKPRIFRQALHDTAAEVCAASDPARGLPGGCGQQGREGSRPEQAQEGFHFISQTCE